MDHSRNDSSGFNRRSSTRRSLALSHAETDDDDEYDLSAMMVADGFRPSNNPASASASASANTPSATSYPQTRYPYQSEIQPYQTSGPSHSQDQSNPLDFSSKDTPNMRIRPTSVSKPPQNPHDSLTLRNDGSSTAAPRQAAISRMSSLSSDSPVLRVESPYRGPSGPSHPYQMYPQRTLSVTTTSTTPAPSSDRSYAGPRGPAHAYDLYTQTTVSEAESTQQSIPLGFTGMGGNYQRQLGPDGEEAGDLIGPMGHMEELPPYTRYPENNFVPKPMTHPISEEPASPDQTIAGAGGIGIATRNPEFSTDDLGLPRTRPSIRSARSDNSHYDVNAAAQDIAEKPIPGKWHTRAKKKMWGIVPYWAICLLIVALVMMGIIMGATIGTVLSRHKSSTPPPPPPGWKHDKPTPTPTTYAAGVEPLETVPPNVFPIETGVFGLPPLDTWSEPRYCLKDTTQLQAWSCKIPYVYYCMNIECLPDGSPTSKYLLTLVPNNAADSMLIYGMQPPHIPDPITLTLVNDTYESGRGPAWYLEKTYNKTVILSEETFSTASKRGWSSYSSIKDFDHSKMKKKVYGAVYGDKPWICTWPSTTLEVFIYTNHNSSSTRTTLTTTSPYDSPKPTVSIADPAETYSPPFQPPQAYPKIIKMVERQVAESAQQFAFCRQVEVINDAGATKDLCDSNGNPIEIVIEQNPWVDEEEYNQKYRHARSLKQWEPRSAIDKKACGCLWYST